MDRALMISQLEEYWYKQQAKYPEECMDIPSAVEYYWTIPMHELQWEYQDKIG